MVWIECGFVAHPVAELAAQSGYCGTPGGIVVKIAQYQRVFRQSRDCFADIRHGVKHNTVVAVIESEAFRRKKVDKALEDVAQGVAVGNMGDMLWRITAFEEAASQLKSVCAVLKTDGIIVFAMQFIIHLHTISLCDVGRYATVCEVTQ